MLTTTPNKPSIDKKQEFIKCLKNQGYNLKQISKKIDSCLDLLGQGDFCNLLITIKNSKKIFSLEDLENLVSKYNSNVSKEEKKDTVDFVSANDSDCKTAKNNLRVQHNFPVNLSKSVSHKIKKTSCTPFKAPEKTTATINTPSIVATIKPEGIVAPVVPLSNDSVTGHTANLWQYNDIPQDEVEPHEEYSYRENVISGGKIIGARVRGKKHKHEGTNCDDWFEFASIDDWVIICVSDGAGSKKLSRIGARESCGAAIKYLREKLAKIKQDASLVQNLAADFSDISFAPTCQILTDIVQKSVLSAFDAVEQAYLSRKEQSEYKKLFTTEMTFKDFSATLLVAIAIPVMIKGEKEYLTVTCQIGDGMLVSFCTHADYSKGIKLLGEADGGDFSGETDFLTSTKMNNQDALMSRTRVARGQITQLMVMTDGVSDDYYPNNPALIRLLYDLKINGILKYSENISSFPAIDDKAKVEIIRKIPSPTSYAWVNDNTVNIDLQYSNKVMQSLGINEEELWNRADILKFVELTVSLTGNSTAENLKIWLDNYVERGSFDDRTLVIFEVE